MLRERRFLTALALGCVIHFTGDCRAQSERPNIILMMADDLGYGDVGYNGNKVIKTPNLDAMSKAGLRFDRFYAQAPVCSPTRGSCITGRHPYRYGIFFANTGHLLKKEVNLAEILKAQGYRTGHFGKWHLGTLTKTVKESNRGGPKGVKHYAPPWERGFEECFSTEAKVPTWNPMIHPENGKPYGTHYWTGPEQRATENLQGDDSRIIMDRAIPFIQKSAKEKNPFFTIIWFHTPHLPVVAGPEYLKLYPKAKGKAQHYFGCITAMDEQIGRLRKELRTLGVAENTLLWFASDNGPEGKAGRAPGSAGPLRGRKRDLYEGGIRVPGLLEWPKKIKGGRHTSIPACTSDYVPTVLDLLKLKLKKDLPLDGVSLLPLIEGAMKARPKAIGFESRNQVAWIDNQWKLYGQIGKQKKMSLYDLSKDVGERTDLSKTYPERLETMRKQLALWRKQIDSR